ncbi:hypothetical protein GWK41_03105 [Persephonella atlantica]|uniref:Ribulose bisphosphate carboxylase large subunit C-terminal domain-containing protein n=1 Tax=Persephonella atlantica TaxID=2699429 RepID=A0ABS1GGS1_9AQUI|nr:RuBisCO large subunit C-terminal-like domain-containing protein [Persephonella atlantica]MBK3332055.1 hypothetical protein [Persephonella atlantica]
MNFISATYLLSSEKRFSPEEKLKEYIKEIFGEGKFSPQISEVEYIHDRDSGLYKALIKIDFPVILFRHDLYSIFTLLYGELVLPENIKLIGVDFPLAFVDHFSGPNFGIKEIRDILGIHHRPLVSIPLKYTNGIKKKDFERLLKSIIDGNPDIVREDEIFFSDAYIPFYERIDTVCKIIESSSRKKILYLPVLAGSVNEIVDKIEFATERGINLFVINIFPVGIESLHLLSETYRVGFLVNPGYPPFFYENDNFGIEPSLFFGKLLRLAGADMVFIPSPYRHREVPHYRSVEIASSLLEDFYNISPSFPVVCGNIQDKDLSRIFSDFGNQVVIDTDNPIRLEEITEAVCSFMDMLECVISGITEEECKSIEKGKKE